MNCAQAVAQRRYRSKVSHKQVKLAIEFNCQALLSQSGGYLAVKRLAAPVATVAASILG